uniref:Uncharacterized protein AlNc14C476G11862 n=1 Tax=Albugo laibachii Nc14 TaxID=890382 RepID=F0X0C4_9STRA|nr:conserved hypothetical protein [Albugo laibachii Nc14]|eukprot:CCA27208.1 conserved hypothetical protein [Albugo laibachii Nc14]
MSSDSNVLRRRNVGNATSADALSHSDASSIAPAESATNTVSSVPLWLFITSKLFGLQCSIDTTDPVAAATCFNESLSATIKESSSAQASFLPSFEVTSFRDAVSTARSTCKFLLVYLHSPLHDDTRHYVDNVLCTNEFCEFINEQEFLVSWAGDVTHLEGYSASLSLGATQYPFIAILSCQSRGVSIVEKFTGNVALKHLLRAMAATIERNHQILNSVRQAEQQRIEAQELRAQQDREYLESLEADRLRDEELRRLQEEQIAQQNQEEEERQCAVRQEKEMAEQKQKILDMKRESVRANPAPSSDTTIEGGEDRVVMLRFRLHNGTKFERRFLCNDTLQFVRDFLDVELHDRGVEITNYELATSYPKRVFGTTEVDLSLKDAGFVPQALIYVQNLDT